MSDEGVSIRAAAAEDLPELLALLAASGLPPEGVAEHLSGFLVARDSAGRLAGCVGLERHGRLGLLRSAAVAPASRRAGLGARLVAELLEGAAEGGIEEVLLLTTTARDFFGQKFGFEGARREDYDGRLASSPEWNLPRCSTAVLMRLGLREREVK